MLRLLLGLGALVVLAGCRLAPDTATDPDPYAVPPAPPPTSDPLRPDTRTAFDTGFDTTVLGGYEVFTVLGVYHGAEAPARDGETWQAVDTTGPGAELRSVQLRVEAARDEVIDPDTGPFTGRRVTTPASVVDEFGGVEDPSTLFVRREAGPLPNGPVSVVADSETTYLRESGAYPLSLDGATYTLTVVADSSEGGFIRQWQISLTTPNGSTQPVTRVPNRDGGHPRLLWAGDLDSDGRLDLVLDESWHYNVTVTTLYVSSEASPGVVLRRVARHETTGC
ncbi:hypothetical protein [Rubrivirga marina]|uniref:Uncharacterized protein n=1 Tax=Rubrivirga marina TaxID=1196024 RepID=A0A271J1E7_9BACT|nr:hypothetical protein [Rubrivirga marina]PAP76785.1 hypothetical protein BSZ37_10235 [Rubrivirga marina]